MMKAIKAWDIFDRAVSAAVLFIAVAMLLDWLMPYDSTDKGDGERSSMALHVDALTGCHYVAKPLGGITPRIAADGYTHHGCKEVTQ